MISYPDAIENLIKTLKRLPGVGKRGAERYAMSLLKWDNDKLVEFGELLQNLNNEIGFCPECGALSNSTEKCSICSSLNRDHSIICVVEDFSQLCTIENSNVYNGLYHILGGKISPLDDEFGENLRMEELLNRVKNGNIKELIIALGADVESRASAIYIADMFKDFSDLKITQLSQGIPAGANLIYADGATINLALRNRIEV